MRLKYIGMEVFPLPGTHAVDKILEDIAGSHLRINIHEVFSFVRTFRIEFFVLDNTFFKEKLVSNFGRIFLPRHAGPVNQTNHLEYQQRPAEVHYCQLTIWRLCLVGIRRMTFCRVHPSAAHTDYALGQQPAGYRPPSNIHLMYALVTYFSISEVPEPVPVIMDYVLVVWLLRSRSKPYIKVQVFRRFFMGLKTDTPTTASILRR